MGKLSKIKGIVDQALDMSHDARMQRAKDMGFDADTVYYHGTDQSSVDAFQSGEEFWPETFFMTPDRDVALQYAESAENPAVMSVISRPESVGIDFDLGGARILSLEKAREFVGQPDWDLQDFAEAGYSLGAKPVNVRSVNAAFDPAKKDSSNLLASMGGAAVLGGAALAPEKAQAFTQRRAAKQDRWKQLKNTILESMAAINRGAVDTLNFIGPDQVNAALQLAGSDQQIPTFNDVPGVQQATQGNYMNPGTARDIVRTGGEFLSPL